MTHPDQGGGEFRLLRLCEWAGHPRSGFDSVCLTEAQPIPPGEVYLTLGPKASALYGVHDLDSSRGYVHDHGSGRFIPTVHPAYIDQGNAKWSAAFINDLQKSVLLARSGMPACFTDYLLDPLPREAYAWAERYLAALRMDPSIRLAFDIETPGKGDDEDDLDTDSDAPDRTWNIERIGFSYEPLGAVSFPWSPPYMAVCRAVLGSGGDKVVWNAGFDVPRIRRSGVEINGLIHDGMVAWHILHSDQPKRLGYVATFAVPWQPRWKHLSGSRPAYYNATDADVELRCMIHIEQELRRTGLWEVYQKDVLDLQPVLDHMHRAGMPVDTEVRLRSAIALNEEIVALRHTMAEAVPLEARKVDHVYKKPPTDTSGLRSRMGTRLVTRCAQCNIESPRKDHFRTFKRKINPCAAAGTREVEEPATEWYRLAEWTPSGDQLRRYHAVRGRPNPTVWDQKRRERRVSFGVKQLRELAVRFPDDPLYPAILRYRELDKIASVYIGRPA